jgi:hypothetical protein
LRALRSLAVHVRYDGHSAALAGEIIELLRNSPALFPHRGETRAAGWFPGLLQTKAKRWMGYRNKRIINAPTNDPGLYSCGTHLA